MSSSKAMTHESPSSGYLPQSPLPSGLLPNTLHSQENPFGQLQSIVPAVSSSIFLPTSSLQVVGAEWVEKGSLDAVEALLSNTESTGVLSTVF